MSTCVLTQTFHSPCRMVLYWIERSGTKVSPPLPARYSPSHPVLLRQIRLSFRHKHSVFVSGGPYGFLSVPLQLRRFAATRPAAPGGLPCSSAFQLEQECLSPCRKGCRGFQMLPPLPRSMPSPFLTPPPDGALTSAWIPRVHERLPLRAPPPFPVVRGNPSLQRYGRLCSPLCFSSCCSTRFGGLF